jgi:hypothetical protein
LQEGVVPVGSPNGTAPLYYACGMNAILGTRAAACNAPFPPAPPSSHQGLAAGYVVGIAVGGAAVMAAVVTGAMLWWRRKAPRSTRELRTPLVGDT